MSSETASTTVNGVATAASPALRERMDLNRALEAYRFFYPTVSMEAAMRGVRVAGVADNTSFIMLNWGPRHLGFTGNSDTTYAFTVLDLRRGGPMVCEVPKGLYGGWLNDHNHRWIQDMGLPGPDGGRGGRYLVLPPDYQGERREGYFVARSPTYKVLAGFRALPLDGDRCAGLRKLPEINVYPLARAATPPRCPFVDLSDKPIDISCLRWEDNISFWQTLRDVIDDEAVSDGSRPMHGLLAAMGIEKGRQFAPDQWTRNVLLEAAKVGRDQMLAEAYASRRPDRLLWPDRRWEWVGLRPESADFETPQYLDLEARERWFAQAIGVTPALFQRIAGVGTLSWLTARDGCGRYLQGDCTYRLRLPRPLPTKLLWSLTIYDAQTRSQMHTDQDKAALSWPIDKFEPEDDGTILIQIGPDVPASGSRQGIKTRPGRPWFGYLRIYNPQQAALDGGWRPGDFEALS